MAGTYTLAPKGTFTPAVVTPKLIPITVVTTGRTYATATGGFNFDFTAIFTAGGGLTYQATINTNDIVAIIGYSSDGYMIVGAVDATTVDQLNIRLYTSGGSEIADSTYTKTLTLLILLAGGSDN